MFLSCTCVFIQGKDRQLTAGRWSRGRARKQQVIPIPFPKEWAVLLHVAGRHVLPDMRTHVYRWRCPVVRGGGCYASESCAVTTRSAIVLRNNNTGYSGEGGVER